MQGCVWKFTPISQGPAAWLAACRPRPLPLETQIIASRMQQGQSANFFMPMFGNNASNLVLVRPPLQRVGAQQESVHSRFLTARIITPKPLVRPGCDTMTCTAGFTFCWSSSVINELFSSMQASSDAAQSFNSFFDTIASEARTCVSFGSRSQAQRFQAGPSLGDPAHFPGRCWPGELETRSICERVCGSRKRQSGRSR